MICPCIQHIEAYEFEKAYDLYKTFTLRLKEKYLCTYGSAVRNPARWFLYS